MKISQVQFSFVPEQDRLLLRVQGDGEEVRAWFTRRLVKLLWPNLMQILARKVGQQQPAASAAARGMLVEMQREELVRNMDFKTPYRDEATAFPLGKEPMLVARVDLTNLADGTTRFSMKPQTGPGVDVNMADTLLHALLELLQQACQRAEWDMELRFPGTGLAPGDINEPRSIN